MSVMDPQKYLQRTINRIMVVLAGNTEESQEAMKYAAGLSKLCGASVTLVYPMKVPVPLILGNPAPVGLGHIPTQVWEESERQAESMLEEAKTAMAGLGASAEGKVLVVEGGVGMTIGKEAKGKYDLVVVPEIRAHGLERLLHSDFAVDVVKNTECPVVVVHAFDKGRPTSVES